MRRLSKDFEPAIFMHLILLKQYSTRKMLRSLCSKLLKMQDIMYSAVRKDLLLQRNIIILSLMKFSNHSLFIHSWIFVLELIALLMLQYRLFYYISKHLKKASYFPYKRKIPLCQRKSVEFIKDSEDIFLEAVHTQFLCGQLLNIMLFCSERLPCSARTVQLQKEPRLRCTAIQFRH